MSNSPITAYLGHHRSGSTWIFRVLRELGAEMLGRRVHYAPGSDSVGEFLASAPSANQSALLCYVNANFETVRNRAMRAFHVVRDPRDLLVSAYYAHAFSHPTDNWAALAEFRQLLAGVGEEVGLLLEIEFCAQVFEDMRSFPREVEGILEVRFESMIEHPWDEFSRIFRHLELDRDVDEPALRALIERHAFEKLSGGRSRGEEDQRQHYRAGRAGDWRQQFTSAVAWAFEARFGDLLRRYGYESSGAWAAARPGIDSDGPRDSI